MTLCYCEIKDIEDTLKAQKDIDRLGIWARKWGMRFQPVKCNMMQLTNEHNITQVRFQGFAALFIFYPFQCFSSLMYVIIHS